MKTGSKVVNLNQIKVNKANKKLEMYSNSLVQDLFAAGSISFILSFNLNFKKTGKYNVLCMTSKEINRSFSNCLLISCAISHLNEINIFEESWENIQTFPEFINTNIPNCEHFDFGILGYFDPLLNSIRIQLFTDLNNHSNFQKRKLYKVIEKMNSLCSGTLSLLDEDLIPAKFRSFFYACSIRHSDSAALLSNLLLIFYQDRLTTCDYSKLKQLCDKYNFLHFDFEAYDKKHKLKPNLQLLRS